MELGISSAGYNDPSAQSDRNDGIGNYSATREIDKQWLEAAKTFRSLSLKKEEAGALSQAEEDELSRNARIVEHGILTDPSGRLYDVFNEIWATGTYFEPAP
ncbi:hypothetical protein FWG95_01575 [Candidatus Saccharibacteria bacterium]|nr:hypothetical protein [Candidatus Saccharibacteria bacterium]